MRLTSPNRWILALVLVGAIIGFTVTGPVYADGNGCKMDESCEIAGHGGSCGFISVSEGDFCVCDIGDALVKTCDCSTGEYPPCGGDEN